MNGLLLRNGFLVSWRPASVEQADLRIRGDAIVERGVGLDADGEEVVDLAGRVVIPGMVCAHTHLYASLARGMPPPPSPPRDFRDVLEKVWWRLDRALDAEGVEASALVGALEAAACGTTTLFDHHSSPSAIRGSLDAVRRGVQAVGLRAALCYEITDRGGPEEAIEGLREHRRFQTDARFRLLVGAHASFTLRPASLSACAAAARDLATGVHIHVAEDPVDALETHARYGMGVVARLMEAGIAGPRSILAHGVHLSPAEIRAASEAGCWFAHNPRSNQNNAVGYAPTTLLPPRTALGTDGLEADMFAEARAAWLKMREERTGLAPERILEMLDAGHRLASDVFHRPIGPLAPGAAADLAVLDYDPPTPLTGATLAGHLLYGLAARHVSDTVVAGQFVYRDRRPAQVEPAAAAERARHSARTLWAGMR